MCERWWLYDMDHDKITVIQADALSNRIPDSKYCYRPEIPGALNRLSTLWNCPTQNTVKDDGPIVLERLAVPGLSSTLLGG